MKIQPLVRWLWCLACSACALVLPGRADIIYTTNGAQIVGTITGVKNDRIEIATTYAGPIAILQTTVTGITTQRPLTVQLADGTQAEGSISSSGAAGSLVVVTPIRTITCRISDLRGIWEASGGRANPGAAVGLKPVWSFELGANLTGRSGLKDQFGASLVARASRISARDNFTARVTLDRQTVSGVRSADQAKGGVDYQRNLTPRALWYARDEGGFDHIRNLRFYDIAAGGIGYDIVKRPAMRMTVRGGLSYRYENFSNPLTKDLAAIGGDFGLANVAILKGNSLVNRITYVQAFDRSRVYRFTHESYFEVPTNLHRLRLRLGLSNDYNSQLSAGSEKFDTTYFAQLMLLWQ